MNMEKQFYHFILAVYARNDIVPDGIKSDPTSMNLTLATCYTSVQRRANNTNKYAVVSLASLSMLIVY
jgi:hypothetical protein